jgi:hypothetical protein
MITVTEYLTQHCEPENVPPDVSLNADILIPLVNALLADPECPSPDAGLRSGYRPLAYNRGVMNAAPNSKHMTGEAVDVNDTDGAIDRWLTDDILEHYQLYREAPSATLSWCHLQCSPPKSGHRTFMP